MLSLSRLFRCDPAAGKTAQSLLRKVPSAGRVFISRCSGEFFLVDFDELVTHLQVLSCLGMRDSVTLIPEPFRAAISSVFNNQLPSCALNVICSSE